MLRYDRPYPTLKKLEIERELSKLTDEQVDMLRDNVIEYFSSRSTGAGMYLDAVRRGWLLGPA